MGNIINADIEASKNQYYKIKSEDPFPDIPPALLNSADIIDYARKAFIISPFYLDEKYFKPASYSIVFSGYYIFWDFIGGKSVRKEEQLKDGEYLTLKSNSIAFLRLEPYIQLPNYLAARFNLQINHVYRGLLLGTGPLVDPGWCGYLNIPLHNLTGEDYKIQKGAPMIWMEFTKVSPNSLWHNTYIKNIKEGKLFPFKETSQNIELKDYLHKAAPNSSIQSSLPKAIDDYNNALKDSKKINKRTERLLTFFSLSIIIGIAGIIGATVGFYYYTSVIAKNTNDYLFKSEELIKSEHNKSIELKQSIINFNQITDSLTKFQKYQQKEIEILSKKLNELNNRR
jgi:deoxycytidine triphosphate deaminase